MQRAATATAEAAATATATKNLPGLGAIETKRPGDGFTNCEPT